VSWLACRAACTTSSWTQTSEEILLAPWCAGWALQQAWEWAATHSLPTLWSGRSMSLSDSRWRPEQLQPSGAVVDLGLHSCCWLILQCALYHVRGLLRGLGFTECGDAGRHTPPSCFCMLLLTMTAGLHPSWCRILPAGIIDVHNLFVLHGLSACCLEGMKARKVGPCAMFCFKPAWCCELLTCRVCQHQEGWETCT
jgi:hypothetical protein